MSETTEKDIVVESQEFPHFSVGAPCPAIIATEHEIKLVYYLSKTIANWDGLNAKRVDPAVTENYCGIIIFSQILAHMMGEPNDEALSGHRLYERGLGAYRVFEIHNSSWIDLYRRMNSVHPSHSDALFDGYKHFVFTFKDSCFECIAKKFDVEIAYGRPQQILANII